jgi:hypothetical protein
MSRVSNALFGGSPGRRTIMTRRRLTRCAGAVGLILAVAFPSALDAKGLSKGAGRRTSHAKTSKARTPRAAKAVRASVPRTANGRIERSAAARHSFARQTGYPHGRPGYVIDHIVPLACGGADAPWNMQWQTVADGKAKDRTERAGCR